MDEEVLDDIQESMEESGEVQSGDAPDSEGAELRLIREGSPTEHAFPLEGTSLIGRHDPNVGPVDVDLGSLEEGVYISRKHAEIRNEDGRWLLKDLGSSNGTFTVDTDGEAQRITDEVELHDGDTIAFGNVRFRFSTGSPEASPDDTPDETVTDEETSAGPG